MISLVAKSARNTLMKIITLDSFGTPKDYTCVNSDDSTYNRKKLVRQNFQTLNWRCLKS